VERGGFHHSPHRLDLWAATDLVSSRAVDVEIRVWTPNTLGLWCGTAHRLRFDPPSHTEAPHSPTTTVSLLPGRTRIVVYLQKRGFRSSPLQFGLELTDPDTDVGIALPGDPALTPSLAGIDAWLESLSSEVGRLQSTQPPDVPVDVILDRPDGSLHKSWPRNETDRAWHKSAVTGVRVSARFENHKLDRPFECPGTERLTTPGETIEEFRIRYLESLAFEANGNPRQTVHALLARHALERQDREADETVLQESLEHVSQNLHGADER